MTKPAEEGKIWEWRAFGEVTGSIAEKVRAYPIRHGLRDLRGEDVYLIAPNSDQNVKLRRQASGWVLKFKLLLETQPGSFELYEESAELSYGFPVTPDKLKEAARLLGVTLVEEALSTASFDEKGFVTALAEASPAATHTRVAKLRSQYQFEGGWLELAEAEFERRSLESLSLHSPNLDVVRRMLDHLKPGDELEAMNYIEACRRWG